MEASAVERLCVTSSDSLPSQEPPSEQGCSRGEPASNHGSSRMAPVSVSELAVQMATSGADSAQIAHI